MSHIWFFKGVPSRIGHLLNMSIRDLERVLYYESYVVVDPGNTAAQGQAGAPQRRTSSWAELVRRTPRTAFEAKMGAESDPKNLLSRSSTSTSSPPSFAHTWSRWRRAPSGRRRSLKRLRRSWRRSARAGISPEWMILEVDPRAAPRPASRWCPLEGGRFATSRTSTTSTAG